MAEGRHFSDMNEEEWEDVEDFIPGPFMYTVVEELKRQGDENVRAKLYDEALVCYTLALNQQAPPFMDIAIISEKLYRKRAVCFFKMGKYVEAIHDSERAIEIADGTNNKNLAKSLFIKVKAIMSLKDYVAAFPIAVWCRHLRPNCETTRAVINDLKTKLKEEFRKDDFLIKVVLYKTLELANEMTINPETRELALDCYTELLHLLDFMILPGVQLRKAKCLLQLGRCKEAKDVCADVLWLRRNDVEALSLMSEIKQQMRQTEMKEAKEKKKQNIGKSEPLTEERKHPATEGPLLSEKQSVQEIKDSSLPVLKSEAKEELVDLDPAQVGGFQSKEQDHVCHSKGSKLKKKKRKKEKKKKMKAKKKAQKKSEKSSDLPPVSNETNSSPDESPDDEDSQATDSVIEDPDISFGYLHMNNTATLTSRHNVSEVDGREESDGEEFTLVQYNRRQPQMGGNEISLDSRTQSKDRVSSLDCIVSSGENCQSSNRVSIQPNVERQRLPQGGAAKMAKIPITDAKARPTELLSEKVMASQDHKTFAITSEDKVSDLSQTKTEAPNLFNSEDFPTLERGPVKVSESSYGALWRNSRAPHLPLGETFPDPSPNKTPVQQGSSFVFLDSPFTEQNQRNPAPASVVQTFQSGKTTVTTDTLADRLTGLNNLSPIPEKVFVVCDHFLRRWPPCNNTQAKTCQSCEDLGMLKYAAWNGIHDQWQVMRQFPAGMIPPTAELDICRHFATRISCRKEPCTFAHGELEKHIWELQREGRLPTPEESLRKLRSTNATAPTLLMTQAKNRNSIPAQAINNRSGYLMTASCRDSTANPSFGFGTVLSQSMSPSLPLNTSPGVQFGMPLKSSPLSATRAIFASQTATPRSDSYRSPIEDSINTKFPLVSCAMPLAPGQPQLPLQPLPVSNIRIAQAALTGAEASEERIAQAAPPVKPTNMIPMVKPEGSVLPYDGQSPSSEKSERSSTPIHRSAQTSISTFQGINQEAVSAQSLSEGGHANSQYPTWSSALKTPGRPSTPIQKTTAIPSTKSSNDYRKVPKGVYVVCDDFLWKNSNRAASIFDNSKACKGCENRSKLKYAFWSDVWKRWELIRPFPKTVKITVAFQECRQYSKRERCREETCLFAHGEQEKTMWTMEREGVLPTPRETLTGSYGGMLSASDENSAAKQPPVQLLYRPPPPGVTNGSYRLCKSYYTSERCRFGRGCLYAHSQQELNEWKQEYDRRATKNLEIKIKEEEEMFYAEILKAPPEDRVECLAGVEVICAPPELNATLRNNEQFKWTFTLTFQQDEVGSLKNILLLHRYHSCFHLTEIRVGCFEEKHGSESYKSCYTAKLKDSWYKSPNTPRMVGRVKLALTVSFESPLYGSFEQLVLFDFGRKPYLVKRLNADVSSGSGTLPIAPVNSATHESAIWDEMSVEVVRFVHETGEALQAEHLSRKYSLPRQVEITEDVLSPRTYKKMVHQLLFVEERFMKEEISRYTLKNAQLHAQWNIFDDMTGMRCAVDGELFGVLRLQEEDALRPDDAAGRLLYRKVNSVWLQLANSGSQTVFEAPVEKVESECVVLRLSSKLCSDLKLHDTCDTAVNAQFQLNRWPLCQLHEAVERLTSGQLRLIFPDPTVGTVISKEKIRWQWLLDKGLNSNQKKVIERIASLEDNALPLVVFGPFGTGKTFTLNQAVRLLVQLDKSNRILLCTLSNRAADIHVELLHEYLTEKNGIPSARPLRVYQSMRRHETTSEVARKYCLIKDGMFVLPCRDDVVEHRVVITTLNTSHVLLGLEVLHGFFTHILIDEAAQALEPEALNPLKFAGTNTKIVFTGDHMQMSPEVYSPQALSLGLQKSLAERLFDLYEKYEAEVSKSKPKQDEDGEPNVLWLTENYRCNEHILKFPSENFYGKKLIARGHEFQPAHPKYGPLLFFSARGKETKEQDNSYLNLSEVYEVEKRVKEIADSWPAVWGSKKLTDIAVLSSYRYQVKAIRRSLRKEKDLSDVKVDTIHNVQGEEFRVLFISTVRTFHTCKPQQEELRNSGSDRQLYWEFLSDPKLLNTAVTRARCMIAVVGDPVSLCTVGECRGIWRDYIKRCNKAGGLYGTTMEELTREISASIASVQLNPEAKTFIPGFLPKIESGLDAKSPEDKIVESVQEEIHVKEVIEEQNVENVLEAESKTRKASAQ
ncbi:uncharacterized protein LOC111336066 [Stylophora pistillata]|uniref:uncharacterized protein LOC111336066 n=1 Tax=Stylophora pistillata TaxID=50429 RepID=UPI000C0407C7|nr:uncharacterized protein LOC111336066 [Stylophora pistillata]